MRREQAVYTRIGGAYGLSQEELEEMERNQNCVCAICGKQETRTRNGLLLRLCIDHNAETGQVRGLLCSKCNVGIGMLDHDPVLISAAVNYLLKYEGDEKLNGKI